MGPFLKSSRRSSDCCGIKSSSGGGGGGSLFKTSRRSSTNSAAWETGNGGNGSHDVIVYSHGKYEKRRATASDSVNSSSTSREDDSSSSASSASAGTPSLAIAANENVNAANVPCSSSNKNNNNGDDPKKNDDDSDLLRQTIRSLELQLHRRDETIAHLRRTMDAEEKVRSERIELLELQLERMVEMSSGEVRALRQVDNNVNRRGSADGGGVSSPSCQVEVSALQELLSRVIAEKDRLDFQNRNLKMTIKQLNGREFCPRCAPASGDKESCKLPSSIEGLDNAILENGAKRDNNKNGKKSRRQSDCLDDENALESKDSKKGTNENVNEEKSANKKDVKSQALKSKTNQVTKTKQEINTTTNDKQQESALPRDKTTASDDVDDDDQGPQKKNQQQLVVYKLSCRSCSKCNISSGIKYVSSYACSSSDGKQELTDLLQLHCDQLWKMVRHEEKGEAATTKGSSCGKSGRSGDYFPSSSLAKHLVQEHCLSFKSVDKVADWCFENIKVEVSKQKHSKNNDGNGNNEQTCSSSSKNERRRRASQVSV